MLHESYWPADTTVPLHETTVGGVLRAAAEAAPGRTALVATPARADPGDLGALRRWTHAELLADSERAAAALLDRFRPGERVGVWAPNVAEWVVLEFGAALAGVVLVTVNPAFRPRELHYVLSQSRAAGVFHVASHRGNDMAGAIAQVQADLPDLREVVDFADWADVLAGAAAEPSLPAVDPLDAVQIQYTSGTTGFPKGALLHHRGITNNGRLCAERLQVEPGAVWLNPMPLFHTGGCVLAVLGAVQSQATHVLVHTFDPALVLRLLEQERATVMGGVPTMLIALMEHPERTERDLSSLRAVLSGGSTVPEELVRRIESTLGVGFGIVFGQTECSPVITQTHLDDGADDKATTIGTALPHTEVKIVDADSGATLPVGTVGELCTRGYHVMHGYFEMPDATAQAIDEDGWLHTGDLCSMDERGYCRVEGRLKDMVIRGGENIYPREIEELLYTHPAVAEVAVLGVPDETWGEQVAAFVRPAGGAQVRAGELAAFVREQLAPQKTPRHWVIVDEFPLTASGKIQKFALRERWEKGELAAGSD